MYHDIDIKYLKVVHVLTLCQSVSKAAEILNISPASVSYAINKLRKITGVHLFIRTKSGMMPDTIAQELSARYKKIINDSASQGENKVLTTREEIVIRSHSMIEAAFFLFSQRMAGKGQQPPYRYRFLAPEYDIGERLFAIKNKNVDIDIGAKLPEDSSISKVRLFTSKVSVLTSANNRKFEHGFTIEDWHKYKHVIWTFGLDYFADDFNDSIEMRKHLDGRNLSIISDSGVNMVALCACSDCIMLVPDFFIRLLEKWFPIRSYALPDGLNLEYDCYLHYNNALASEKDVIDNIGQIIEKFKEAELVPSIA